jgi:hypothetical protein
MALIQIAMKNAKPPARITARRSAGSDHEVITVEVEGGAGLYRREPCARCPWRIDQTGVFPAEAFRHSANTAYDMAQETFACHESGAKKPAICAGFLLRGAEHNLSIRLKLSKREIAPDEVGDGGHALHSDYRAMAIANGVPPADPALVRCR